MIDNADDPEINLQQFFPRCAHGNIIITSRNRDCRRHAPDSNVHVSGMDTHDAVELLLRSAMLEGSARNRDTAASICQELGYHALAIAQAGAYISQACSLDDFLKIYHEDRAKLLQRRTVQASGDYKWSVYTTWEMSVDKLSSTAATLLRLCAFIHHDGIRRAMFENAAAAPAGAAHDNRESFRDASHFLANFRSASGEWSNQRFLDSVRELASYSLINVDADGHVYSIHPLVHTWARERTSTKERHQARICMSQLLALAVGDNYSSEGFAFRRTLLPHIDEARTGNMNPDVAERLARVYVEGGRWAVAEELQRTVLEARRELLGKGHPSTLGSMNDLAFTYMNQGRWKEAESLQMKVMKTSRRVLGHEHTDTLRSTSHLALTYWNQGQWKDAETLQVQVMETRRRILGHEHPDTLTSMNDLAMTYGNQGRWKEAEMLDVEVIETRRKLLGHKHPRTLVSMGNLAYTYRNQQRWKEAEELYREVLQGQRRLHEPPRIPAIATNTLPAQCEDIPDASCHPATST